MTFHGWFGRHEADLKASHWDRGNFVSRCTTCGLPMEKMPGMTWQLQSRPH